MRVTQYYTLILKVFSQKYTVEIKLKVTIMVWCKTEKRITQSIAEREPLISRHLNNEGENKKGYLFTERKLNFHEMTAQS